VLSVDLWTSIGLMALSCVVFLSSLGMPKPRFGLGPGAYPRVVSIVLFMLAAALAFGSWKSRAEEARRLKIAPGGFRRILVLTVVTLAYIQLLKVLGFVYLTPFFLMVVLYIFGYRKPLASVAIGVGTTPALYVVFELTFKVLLPEFTLF